MRISFGFYSSCSEVDSTLSALWDIQNGNWQGNYLQSPKSGEYKPASTATDPAGCFVI